MKPSILFSLLCIALAPAALAQLAVPSDGSDGALIVSSNTVIDLSQAVTGSWDANNSDHAGSGIYDSNQWAVVFKYSSVTLYANRDTNGTLTGNNVTFINHPSHAPVIWLVQGNVAINGNLNLNGQPGTSATPQQYFPAEPGPGGFRGGASGPLGTGSGYGPGGGMAGIGLGSSGSYAGAYGNPQILPLIGGSGSAGVSGGFSGTYSGSAGGGAILIVAGGNVSVSGSITANGGSIGSANGSGGAIRIVADQILGNGTIDASLPAGAPGRTRMEANFLSPQLTIFPNAIAVPPTKTPVIFPATNAPAVSLVSVDGQPAPADPTAPLSSTADLRIQNPNPVNLIFQTRNLPIQGTVSVRVTPKYGPTTILTATNVSGDINQALCQATAHLPEGFCVIQARATAP